MTEKYGKETLSIGRDSIESFSPCRSELKKESWNKKNLGFSNTEEFQYLEKIDILYEAIGNIAGTIVTLGKKELRKIEKEEEKKKKDFARLLKIIEELEKEILNF